MDELRREILDVEARPLLAKIRQALASFAGPCAHLQKATTEAGALLERSGAPPPAVSWEALHALASAAEEVVSAAQGMTLGADAPRWDSTRRILSLGGRVVKRFHMPAPDQEAVLAVFEEEGWPPRVDDPLPPKPDLVPKLRLRLTIQSLNKRHKEHLIHFSGDGTGEGVRWEACGVAAAPPP